MIRLPLPKSTNFPRFNIATLTSLLLLQTQSSSQLSAQCQTQCNTQCHNQPVCYPTNKHCGFYVGFDALYWKPCLDEMDYTATTELQSSSSHHPKVSYKSVCPTFDTGVRINFGFDHIFAGCGINTSYTYFDTHKNSSTEGDNNLAALLGHPNLIDNNLYNTAGAKWKIRLQEWEGVITRAITWNKCHVATPFFGAAGVNFDEKLNVTYTGDDYQGVVNWSSQYAGVGIRGGINYSCNFERALRFFGSASGTIVIGNADSYNRQTFTDAFNGNPIKFKDDEKCRFVPGYHLAVGIAADGKFCGGEMDIHVGYEFTEWCNVRNPRIFTGEDNGTIAHSTSPDSRTLGFHGLFAGIDFVF